MKYRAFSLLLLFLIGLLALDSPQAIGQDVDPSDQFLKAYLAAQGGEKLEREGKLQAAAKKFHSAANLLEKIRNESPDWQPLVVSYRTRKVNDGLTRVATKLGTETVEAPPKLPTSSYEPALEGPLPTETEQYTQSPPSLAVSPGLNTSGTDGLDAAAREVRAKIRQLEYELNTARRESAALKQEKTQLSRQLDATDAELRDTKRSVDKAKLRETEVRAELKEIKGALSKAILENTGTDKLQAQIKSLNQELANVRAEQDVAEEENDDLALRLAVTNKSVTTLSSEHEAMLAERKVILAERDKIAKERDLATSERDKATEERNLATAARDKIATERDQAVTELAETKKLRKADQELLASHQEVLDKLSAAEAKIVSLKKGTADSDELIALRHQFATLREQLAIAKKQTFEQQSSIAELQTKLDTANKHLAKARTNSASSEEAQKLTEENTLLRNIVQRELREQARRDQAKKLVLEELGNLDVKSEVVMTQLDFLSQPIFKLDEKELSMLRASQMEMSSAITPADVALSAAVTKPVTDPSGTAGPTVATEPVPSVPAALEPIAREARQHFQRGEYKDAEALYEKILNEAPDNVYALSNLGVVRFRGGRLKAAELAFKKAIAINPEDSFSHTTLGIVYYRQGRYDQAIDVLTTAIALNPKNAVAHNHLGITASQKGWHEAAEKELHAAISLNPAYAEAHFNLAVVYAVGQPPSKEIARLHYKKAVELGAEKDSALEKLIQ